MIDAQSLDTIERSVLAAALRNADIREQLVSQATPDWWQALEHRTLFGALQNVVRQHLPIDVPTLIAEARKGSVSVADTPLNIDWLRESWKLADTVTPESVEKTHLPELRRAYQIRAFQGLAGALMEKCELGDSGDVATWLAGRIEAIMGMRDVTPIVTDAEVLMSIKSASESDYGPLTGIRELDESDFRLSPQKTTIIAARPGHGKCLSHDTLVEDGDTGERMPIEMFVRERRNSIVGISDNGSLRKTTVEDWIDNGEVECFKLSTRSGRTINATANHPFLTIHGWTPLSALSTRDFVAVPRRSDTIGSINATHSLVRLMAYFIAEGTCAESTPGFTNTDPEIVSDFKAAIGEHFSDCAIRQNGITYYPCRPQSRPRIGKLGPNPVATWLRELKQNCLSYAKYIPDVVWTYDRASLAQFLSALYSCDGSIFLRNKSETVIEFTVASPLLAKDVHHALLRFGISARFFKSNVRAWRVVFSDSASVGIFNREIGWIGEKATRFLSYPKRASNINIGNPPQPVWEYVRSAASRSAMSLTSLARVSGESVPSDGYNPHTKRAIARERLSRYATALKDDHLKAISNVDIYWDEVTSMKSIGSRRVYDLTVPDGSNFVAEDFIVHNSSLSRQIAISAAAQGVGVLYVAAEEGITGWQEARIQMLTGEPIHLLTTGKASSRALAIYQSFVSDAYERPIYVVGNVPALTAYDVIAEARRHKKHNAALGVVIVDQMQALVGWSDTKRGEGRDQGPKRIVDELVRGCRELGVHLVAVQQLNRDLEKGGRKREPRPADLADTAFFEQVADAILFVYRENYDPEDHDVDAEDTHAIIKFGKRRRGRKARLHVPWNGAYTRIGDWKDPIVEKIERELRLRGRPVPFGER